MGTINSDMVAYVKGKTPDFASSSEESYPLGEAPINGFNVPAFGISHGEQLAGEPKKDAFVQREGENIVKPFVIPVPSSWTSLLAGGGIMGLGMWIGSKIKSKEIEKPKGIKGFMHNIREKLSSWLDPNKEAKAAAEKARLEAEKASKTIMGRIKNFFTKHKAIKNISIGAGVLLSAVGIYSLISGITKSNKNNQPQKAE